MEPKCIGKPVIKGESYIHPLYFVKKIINTECECPTSIYYEDGILKIDKKASPKETYDINNSFFDIKAFLYIVYNIRTFDEAIKWTENNMNEEISYIERMWDLVWDGLFEEKYLEDDILINKIVSLFVILYKSEYSLIDKSLRKILTSYSDLSFHSKKSYQKILKKYINSNI